MYKEKKRRREAERFFESLPPEFFEWIKEAVKKEILQELLAKVKQQFKTGGGRGGGVTQTEADNRYVNVVGDIMTGALVAPTVALDDYMDIGIGGIPANPAADKLRLYVEDFKGFPFYSFRDSTGMVRKLVRDSVFVGKNVTGTAIPANRAVYAVGSVDGVPSLGKARANLLATMPCIGVTTEEIADGAFGRVMQVGLVENVAIHCMCHRLPRGFL